HAKSNFSSICFADYRQTEIVNFLLGENKFTQPSTKDVEIAISEAKDLSSWPSSESVFMIDDIVVVLLQPYEDGISTTFAK
ncbi:MAG: hypothetical protein GQ527_09920, partial [Bacteroidales bacterium]|nr:hypothetical protein [Bacteroidales bacterium]